MSKLQGIIDQVDELLGEVDVTMSTTSVDEDAWVRLSDQKQHLYRAISYLQCARIVEHRMMMEYQLSMRLHTLPPERIQVSICATCLRDMPAGCDNDDCATKREYARRVEADARST